MMRKRLHRDEVTFTADTDDIKVVRPVYAHSLDIGFQALQDGAVAPTLATLLTEISLVQVKLGGRIMTELSGTDIVALNTLKGNREINYVVSGGDNQFNVVAGMSIPLAVSPSAEEMAARFVFLDLATTDTQTLTFATLESDEALEAKRYEMPRYSFTPPSTGAYNIALDTVFSGDLEGLMVFSTTIPVATAYTTSAAKIRLLVNGAITYETNWIDASTQSNYAGDATIRAIVDNYVYLDFSKAPIPAGSRVEIHVLSDDTNTVRLHPVLRV